MDIVDFPVQYINKTDKWIYYYSVLAWSSTTHCHSTIISIASAEHHNISTFGHFVTSENASQMMTREVSPCRLFQANSTTATPFYTKRRSQTSLNYSVFTTVHSRACCYRRPKARLQNADTGRSSLAANCRTHRPQSVIAHIQDANERTA